MTIHIFWQLLAIQAMSTPEILRGREQMCWVEMPPWSVQLRLQNGTSRLDVFAPLPWFMRKVQCRRLGQFGAS